MSSSNAGPLIDFILESERNLRVAEAAFESFEGARDQIIRGFCQRLGQRLNKKLIGWQFEYRWPFFTDRYGAFDLWKPTWRDQYHLRLEAWDYGARMIYGVWRDEGNIPRRPFTGEILTQVKKAHPSAKARIYYEAEVRLRSPEPDWRPIDVLWQIHTDRSFLADVAGQMLEIVTLTEKIIDSVVAKHARR
jgi:hypothetical protein